MVAPLSRRSTRAGNQPLSASWTSVRARVRARDRVRARVRVRVRVRVRAMVRARATVRVRVSPHRGDERREYPRQKAPHEHLGLGRGWVKAKG